MGNRRKIIEELLRGRDSANQLKHVINGDIDDSASSSTPFAEQLLKQIQMSFTNSILFLNNPNSEIFHDVSDVQLWDSSKSEDSQESNCKSSTIKERRGCYKRRRTSHTWEKESEAPIEDGHQWRKYGQKVILNSQFPRSYYRCTHKYDQKCQATKQVQRIQENPPLFRTTYYGHHTCRNLLNPEIILDDSVSPSASNPVFLSFDNTFPNPNPARQDCPFLSSSYQQQSSLKIECKEEEILPSSSSNDYLIPSELTFNEHVNLSSTLESDYKGLISDEFYASAQLDDDFIKPFLDDEFR